MLYEGVNKDNINLHGGDSKDRIKPPKTRRLNKEVVTEHQMALESSGDSLEALNPSIWSASAAFRLLLSTIWA